MNWEYKRVRAEITETVDISTMMRQSGQPVREPELVEGKDGVLDALQQYGAQGWELVQVVPLGKDSFDLYLKRQLR